jgi:hypothetical protein
MAGNYVLRDIKENNKKKREALTLNIKILLAYLCLKYDKNFRYAS